ncbi:MAG: hypothetical protein AMXMBFR84_16990 [Candidatus Hydrogenedentota bacterium]
MWNERLFRWGIVLVALAASSPIFLWEANRNQQKHASPSTPIPLASTSTASHEPASAAIPANIRPDVPSPAPSGPSSETSQDPAWMSQVQEGIRKAEYNITWQDNSVIEGEPGGLHATNRAANLRAYFREDGVQIVERETSDPDWDIRWQFKAWGREGAMREVSKVKPESDSHTNRLAYKHPGIEEWYVNDERGLEHGFTIAERPAGDGALVIAGAFGGSAQAANSGNGIAFRDEDNNVLLQYAKLEVFDATGKSIPATLRQLDGETRFTIHDADAVYPIEVDPIYVPPPIGDWQAEGNWDDAFMGASVTGAGDVNGDGYADAIVGAPQYDNGQYGEGAAFVFHGSISGLVGSDPSSAASVLESNQVNAFMGQSVSGAGDVNGDGYADVIVGAWHYDNGQDDEGAAFVFHGSSSGLVGSDPSSAASVLESNQVNAFMGQSVSGAEDVNGDGYADVIVGSLYYNNGQVDEGAAFVFHGSASGLVGSNPSNAATALESNMEDAFMGISVSSAGDLNGDGYADVIVGASGYTNGQFDEGAAFVFHGSSSGLVGSDPSSAASVLESNQEGALLGGSVMGAGDVNGDRYADVIVGAPLYDKGQDYNGQIIDGGAVFVFHGSASGLVGSDPSSAASVLESRQNEAAMGYSVSCAGDVNGDGYADVIAGAPLYNNGQNIFVNGQNDGGVAFVFHGSASGLVGSDPLSAAFVLESTQEGARMGFSVSGAGDVNGDGYADVIVGAPYYFNGRNDEGGAFVFHGSASGLVGSDPASAASVLESNQEYARMGYSISGAGDVNGDGYADIIVGAPEYDNGHDNEGAAFLFLGSASGLVGSDPASAASLLESNQDDAFMGASVTGAGDVNGDGYADVIVGAPSYDNGHTNEGAAFVFHGSALGIVGRDPSSAASVLESNFEGAGMGYSASDAGDVNGDGYADVIVGAPGYYFFFGEIFYEGLVVVYLGSASGIVNDEGGVGGVAWYLQGGGLFGLSVDGAGDVNGDGYADIIVGAPYYDNGQTSEGAAFVFHGSAWGIVGWDTSFAASVLESNQMNSYMGSSVSGAGDVNGDGYADVIVGATDYNIGQVDEGAAFVFHGSASGLVGSDALSAASLLESNQATSYMGYSVSGAGDVNGDGYADVIVGALYYDNGQTDEGAAFVFHGSASGLLGSDPSSAASVLESNQADAWMGRSVSGAGDLNGDGYADVIVGASGYTNGQFDEGAAFVFLGTSEGKLVNAQLRDNANTLLATPGILTRSPDLRIQILAHDSPELRSAVRLEWEVIPYGAPFEGTDTFTTDTWILPGFAGHPYDEPFTVQEEANGFRWRVRVLHAPLSKFQNNGGVLSIKPGHALPPHPAHSRWYYPHWATVGPSDFRTSGYLPPTNAEYAVFASGPFRTTDSVACEVFVPSASPSVPPRANQHEFKWKSNTGREIIHITASTADALLALETVKGETWTCTVRGFDGVSYSHSSTQAAGSVAILNTPPGAPAASITSSFNNRQSANSSMVCQITTPSADPDVDEQVESLVYRYEWYKNGVLALTSPGAGSTFTSALTSTVPKEQIAPGDQWYCIVTPKDTEVEGPSAQTATVDVVAGGVLPSDVINFGALPQPVVLGNPVTLSAQITPAPASPGSAGLSFAVTPPSGSPQNVPFGTLDGTFYRASFLPNAATPDTSLWSVTAAWPGDATYSAATSNSMTFAVEKAQPTLTIAPSRSSALLNFANAPDFEVNVTMSVPGFPGALQTLLANQPVYVSVALGNEPKGEVMVNTNASGAAVFTKAVFDAGNILFDEEGVWRFKAEFRGDANFKTAATADFDDTDATLEIKAGAGYAIVVHGRLNADGEGVPEHAVTADGVYRALVAREFAQSDIYYLRQTGLTIPSDIQVARDINNVQIQPSPTALSSAITQWAKDKVQTSRAPLYLILVSHGSVDKVHLDVPGTGPQEEMSATQLRDVLNEFDGYFPGNPPQTFVIYGACHSGSFVSKLSKANRLVITSARSTEKSYRGVDPTPDDGIDIRDGEYFVSELFRNLTDGLTFFTAFNRASDRTIEYTSIESASALGDQNPLLDDAGLFAATSILGLQSNAVGGISWFNAQQSFQFTPSKASSAFLFAETAALGRAFGASDKAWIEIKTPAYAPENADGLTDFQREAQMVGPLAPTTQTPLSGDKMQFEWDQSTVVSAINAQVPMASTPGTYKVYYFLKDGVTGQVASYLITNIYVPKPGNQPPNAPTLLYPGNNAVTSTSPVLAWIPANPVDPDAGDTVSYRVELTPTTGDPVLIENIHQTFVQASGLQDLMTYTWRVVAVDSSGAETPSATTRTFSVNNGNPGSAGTIYGVVTDGSTGQPLGGATVTMTGPGAKPPFTTGNDGYYLFSDVPSGEVYTITGSKTGYFSVSSIATLSAGQVLLLPTFFLMPNTTLLKGTVAVQTNTATASWSITGPSPLAGVGNKTQLDSIAGVYFVTWNPLPGLITPPGEQKTLAANQTITFVGNYTAPPPGTIAVRVNGVSANWTINGTLKTGAAFGPQVHQGSNDLTGMQPGTYTVTWGTVGGWISPWNQPDGPKELTQGGSLVFEGTYTAIPAPPPSTGRKSAIERIALEVREEVLPLDVEAKVDATIHSTQPIAVRITADAAIDPATVSMTMEGDLGYRAEGGSWLPITESDGWIVFTPESPYAMGERITATATAALTDGNALAPVSYEFVVSGGAGPGEDAPTMVAMTDAPAMDPSMSSIAGEVFRVGPSGVFAEPVTVYLPVPEGVDANSLVVLYYSESGRHQGWFPVEHVAGLLADDSTRIVQEADREYFMVQLNHSAVLALASHAEISLGAIGPMELAASGTTRAWITFTLILAASIAILLKTARRTRQDL